MDDKKQDANFRHTPYPIRDTSRAQRGMTFIEMLVWISMFIVIMIAVVSSLLYFYRANRYALEQASAITSAQRGLEQVVRMIREGAYSSQGAFPIISIAADDFVFYADIDADYSIELVHYYLDETNLMRGVIEPTGNPPEYTGVETVSVVADYVRNTEQGVSTFRYYDELGVEITDYDNWTGVRFVKVALAVNVDAATLPNQLTIDSSAAIRNLMGR